MKAALCLLVDLLPLALQLLLNFALSFVVALLRSLALLFEHAHPCLLLRLQLQLHVLPGCVTPLLRL